LEPERNEQILLSSLYIEISNLSVSFQPWPPTLHPTSNMTDDEDDEDDLQTWTHQLNPNQYPPEHVFKTLAEVSKNPYNREIKNKLNAMYKDIFRKEVPKKQTKNLPWIFKKISETNATKLKRFKVYRGLDSRQCKLVCLLVRKTKNKRSTMKNKYKNSAIEPATSSNGATSNDSSSNESSDSSSNESSNEVVETSNQSSNAFANYYNVKQQQQREFRKQQSKKRSRAKKSSSSTSSYNKKMKFSSSKDNEIKKLRRQLKVSTNQCHQLNKHIKYLKNLLKVCNQEYQRMGKIFNKR